MHKSMVLCACVLVMGSLFSASFDYRDLMAGSGMSDEEIDFAMQYMDGLGIELPTDEQPEVLAAEPMGDEFQVPPFDEGTEQRLLWQAKQIFAELQNELSARESIVLRSLFPRNPTFDGQGASTYGLQDISLMTSTLLASALDAHLAAALCTAAFSYWPDQSPIVSNYAVSLASLVSTGEALSFGQDEVITIASYAVHCSLDQGRYTAASVRRLLSLGELYNAFERYEEASGGASERAHWMPPTAKSSLALAASIKSWAGCTGQKPVANRQYRLRPCRAGPSNRGRLVADYLTAPVEAMEPAFLSGKQRAGYSCDFTRIRSPE